MKLRRRGRPEADGLAHATGDGRHAHHLGGPPTSRRHAAARRWVSLALVCAAAFALQQGVQWVGDAAVARQIAAAARPGDLRLVSSVGCVYCAAARAWLDGHGIAYRECLIEHDADCAAVYRAAGTPGTPLVLVRGAPQVGFSPQRVARALQAG